MHQESLLSEKRVRGKRGKRLRRIIVPIEGSAHSLIEATAHLGGYAGIEEYARKAILEKFERDRDTCRTAMKGDE